ncbi:MULTISPECIES: hypothetical protein [unclassified Bradyrhizobium]|uniref:hypothetical protein n=1 Tax=unclassified Bradyrhizobium TaxID=2631580 RepID=UPI002305F090|nr:MULTISPECIES: hypothetical protein [unclassified Bradyrhizobium]MDA9409407.1 hypothetical protein [Bradyrhizobium sp. CCBAU 45384]MDA9443439.1 hypothetical protein [Bradyrhizobium sp. CCBAU 51745]
MAKKAGVRVVHKGRGVAIVRLTMPAKSTTGRHVESRPYIVVPLTGGTLDRDTYTGAKGTKAKKDKIRLKPFVTYERKTGRGLDHELFNNGDETVVLLKCYLPK